MADLIGTGRILLPEGTELAVGYRLERSYAVDPSMQPYEPPDVPNGWEGLVQYVDPSVARDPDGHLIVQNGAKATIKGDRALSTGSGYRHIRVGEFDSDPFDL